MRLIFGLWTVLLGFSAAAEEWTLATWNIEHLGLIGEGCLIRDQADLDVVRRYVDQLDADVIALQEVASQEAAEQIFDPEEYSVVISERHYDGLHRPYCWGRPPNVLGDLRTGFALRKHILFRVNTELAALGKTDLGKNSAPWGVDVSIETALGPVRLLSVHLMNGCAEGANDSSSRCRTLFSQTPVLSAWISDREAEGRPYAILGDFNRYWAPKGSFWSEAGANELTNPLPQTIDQCFSLPKMIDHILLSSGLAARTTKAGVLDIHRFDYKNFKVSDHCPVAVHFNP